jgi:hypothetical protein
MSVVWRPVVVAADRNAGSPTPGSRKPAVVEGPPASVTEKPVRAENPEIRSHLHVE